MQSQSSYSSSNSTLRAKVSDVLGGDVRVVFCGLPEKKAYNTWDSLVKELSLLDKTFNSKRQGSEVGILNASAVDIETSLLMKEALNLNENFVVRTDGYFDVSKGGNELDFGAFAKAFALGRMATVFKKNKVRDYFVNFADSALMGLGHGPYGSDWEYELTSASDDVLAEFPLKDEALVISGDGTLTDPKTGLEKDFPGQYCVVRGKDALEAKAFSIALLLCPPAAKSEIEAEFPSYTVAYRL